MLVKVVTLGADDRREAEHAEVMVSYCKYDA